MTINSLECSKCGAQIDEGNYSVLWTYPWMGMCGLGCSDCWPVTYSYAPYVDSKSHSWPEFKAITERLYGNFISHDIYAQALQAIDDLERRLDSAQREKFKRNHSHEKENVSR